MSTRPWWAHAVQLVVLLAVLGLVMRWLARSREGKAAKADPDLMRHTTAVLIVGVVCAGFFLVLGAGMYLAPGKNQPAWAPLVWVPFASIGLFVIYAWLVDRYRLDPNGMRYRVWYGRLRSLHWLEVTRVRWAAGGKWFRIDTARGEVVRITALHTGQQRFAQRVLEKVSRSHIDAQTRKVLEAAAAGDLPPIWG